MPEHMPDLTQEQNGSLREETCIHTRKIYDSCQAKDCIEDIRFYPTVSSQAVIDTALSLKAGKAELLYVYLDVQPIGLGRGFYAIDTRFFYRMTFETAVTCSRTTPITGLAVFEKRSVLFGSEGTARSFTSEDACTKLETGNLPSYTNLPIAVCEAVDPLVLSMKIAEPCEAPCTCDVPVSDIPAAILALFDEDLVFAGNNTRRIYFTLGQFSILRLERDTQLLIPVSDYCMPRTECSNSNQEEDPCALFQQVGIL